MSEVPARSRAGLGDTITLVGASGSTLMWASPIVGLLTRSWSEATAATLSVPVAPALTKPVESTFPSKNPPLVNQRIVTPAIAFPAESYAMAVRRSVSPTFSANSAGRTTTRAIGWGSVGGGGITGCCADTRRAASANRTWVVMQGPRANDEGPTAWRQDRLPARPSWRK